MISIIQAGIFPAEHELKLKQLFKTYVLDPNEHNDGALAQSAGEIRGIAVRHYRLDKDFLSHFPNLEVISSYSAGLDNIDLEYCHHQGIKIYNTSSILANDVADLALGLALAITRNLVAAHQFITDGKWLTGSFPLGHSFSALKIGIVGLGHVGTAIAKRCQVMGASIAYFSRSKKEEEYLYFSNLEELALWSDLLFVCCALSNETVGIINHKVLERLGYGFLVNVARGEIVDENALLKALANNQLNKVALDVFTHEPKVANELLNNPRVVLSPHLGSATQETRQKMGEHAINVLVDYFRVVPQKAHSS